ncbi:MAG: GDP-mannose 4,6-dehydratase [Flavobacteriales bacterium]
METILVTGGAGFIGSHVCEALLSAGLGVRCFDSLITGKPGNVAHLEGKPGFAFVQGDIGDLDALAKALEGVQRVVHLAALGSVPRSIADPLATEAANLTGTLALFESCRRAGVRRVVYASSSSVYGDSPALPKKEGQEGNPLSPYAVTKVMDEAYARLYFEQHGLEVIGLRFFNVFGERQDPEGPYAAAIPKFIRSFLQHQPPVLNGDGRQTRDFTYVGNAVQAVRCSLDATDPAALGKVFNIAYGSTCDLLSLVEQLKERLVGIDPAIAGVGVEHAPERAGDVRASLADISKARRLLGFDPRYSLAQGLDRVVPWYAAQAHPAERPAG